MAITTLAALRAHIGMSGTADDTQLQFFLDSAQDAIQDHTRRVFDAGTATSTRYYADDPYTFSGQRLYLDGEVLSVAELVNGNGGTIDSSSYTLMPRNLPPYSIIELKTNEIWNWNTDGEVAVTGVWGYSATAPYKVQEACLELAAYYYRLKDVSTMDVAGPPEGPQMTVPRGMPKNVYDLLTPYRKRQR